MLLNQPLAARFGTELLIELANPKWTSFEFAVAWVRRSGTDHLRPAIEAFLHRGGHVQATVGVDLENTSFEGLDALLKMESAGRMETHVFHDEGRVVFHPKMYLFAGGNRGRLFVGSNNLTESGLYTNTEVAFRFDGSLTSPTMTEAQAALDAWHAQPSELVRRLDRSFLVELQVHGYVRSEADLRKRRIQETKRVAVGRRPKRLFGTERHMAPAAPPRRPSAPIAAGAAASPTGQVLLMRVRASRGGVQVQLPKSLRTSTFVGPANSLRSAHDGQLRTIGAASARGIINTYKFDAPEVRGMTEPLLRLHWVGTELKYEAFDAATPQGQLIHAQLLDGFSSFPVLTRSSKRDRTNATWWRLI